MDLPVTARSSATLAVALARPIGSLTSALKMAAHLLRVLLLICCVAASPGAAASSTLDRVRETGTITFAYRDHAAPFSYTDRDGRVRGYSAELCTAVAASIQQSLKLPTLKVVWQPVDAANRLDVGLVHAVEELPRVCGKGFDVAALALGIEDVEGETGLSRA